jgi:hypothetical protein
MSFDPTQAEMVSFLRDTFGSEIDDFDIAEATYWFAVDWHGGQWSNLYSAQCSNPFRPGIVANGPERESLAAYAYDALEREYGDLAATIRAKL